MRPRSAFFGIEARLNAGSLYHLRIPEWLIRISGMRNHRRFDQKIVNHRRVAVIFIWWREHPRQKLKRRCAVEKQASGAKGLGPGCMRTSIDAKSLTQ